MLRQLGDCLRVMGARRVHIPRRCFSWSITLRDEETTVEPVHPALFTRSDQLLVEFKELEGKINQGNKMDVKDSRRYNKLNEFVQLFNGYQDLNANYTELVEIVSNKEEDPLMVEEAQLEIDEMIPRLNALIVKLKSELLPKHPFSDKATLIELRSGVGGNESNIFTQDLLEMYTKYCQYHNWKYEIINIGEHQSGNGITEASIIINELGSYNRLRHESGVHRVQRVPLTETKNRVHTSTSAVVILPKFEETDNNDPELRQFKQGELKIDVMRASGAGGQHVNTTESAVRITHIPTGLVVINQDERSQPRNKAKAMMVLRARLAERELRIKQEKDKKDRTDQVTTTDRSDKIRTYNFPQNRITDHRCNYTLYDIEGCLNGSKLDEIIDKVDQWELTKKSEALIEGST